MALGHADMVLLLALAARVRDAMAKDGFVPKLAQKKNVKDDDDAMFPMFPWEEEEDNKLVQEDMDRKCRVLLLTRALKKKKKNN